MPYLITCAAVMNCILPHNLIILSHILLMQFLQSTCILYLNLLLFKPFAKHMSV